MDAAPSTPTGLNSVNNLDRTHAPAAAAVSRWRWQTRWQVLGFRVSEFFGSHAEILNGSVGCSVQRFATSADSVMSVADADSL